MVLQTSYNDRHDISTLYITDFETGKFIKELKLYKSDGSDNTNHVGGITTDNDKVWISSNYELNEYNLNEIIKTNESAVKSIKDVKLYNRGDFCLYHNNILWVGDFYLKFIYELPKKKPFLMGYYIENDVDFSIPNYIVSIPNMIQGMAITNDNKFIFTRSYSGLVNSSLCFYNNILQENNDYYELNGNKIPYYKFDKNNLINNKKIPPMAEGLFIKDESIYILFESSADKYFSAYPKINKVIKLKEI